MSPECLSLYIPLPDHFENDAEKNAFVVKSLIKLAEDYVNNNPETVEILNDIEISELIRSVPLESIECTEHLDGTYTIDLENIRLAVENLLADHSFDYEVILEHDKLIIQEIPDTIEENDCDTHPFYNEMLPKAFGGGV